MFERAALALLHRLDPERAHDISLRALTLGLTPRPGPYSSAMLQTRFCGLDLANPIGLAAGYDKNAAALRALSYAGFGFIEVGAATPHPQSGNPKPRLFRLPQAQGVINRFGFNNDGIEAIAGRLAAHQRNIPVGLNLGANKDSADRIRDYAEVLTRAEPYIDFATINVSSPNTERLRDLQGARALQSVIEATQSARQTQIPLLVKIAPDLDDAALADVAQVCLALNVDGIIATNTTISRDTLVGPHKDEPGGLSGQPLFQRATRILARLYLLTEGKIPLIGVGGVASAEQAYAKILAGASAVQLYSGLVYNGLSLIGEINTGLERLLARDGFACIAQAVGTQARSSAG